MVNIHLKADAGSSVPLVDDKDWGCCAPEQTAFWVSWPSAQGVAE